MLAVDIDMYRIQCRSCSRPYDAEKAADCSCLQPVRSVRCPHCAACSCTAPKAFRDAFWRDATPALWERRRATLEDTGAPQHTNLDGTRPIVLFADDDATGRVIARRVVASLGYDIALAENGLEALELARRYKPELIITDALMPHLDGREMGRLFKLENPSTKVVVITSVYKDPRYKYEAFRNFGADEFLTKPVNPGELRAIIQKYLTS
jgi:CheY-like chemotaxis protein